MQHRRPFFHEHVDDYRSEELWAEHYLYEFFQRPEAVDEVHAELQEIEAAKSAGKVIVATGDALMDKIAVAEAQGETVDLMEEFFGPEEAERIRKKYHKEK